MPLPEPDAPCAHCLGSGIAHYDRVLAMAPFREPVRHLIHQMKYHGRWAIAELLADAWINKRLQLPADALLLPVPLHRIRQVIRGFNQADVIARRIGKSCGLRLVHPAVRLKRTKNQSLTSSQAQRTDNLRDAFGLISPHKIRGRHVVVIDDVMTTGATLLSLARVLREAQPASLTALVIARADPVSHDFQSI